MADVCTQGVDTGFVALGYAKVSVLGVVQGITELLPISSTAHMRIVPALLGWQDPGSAFSAAMQLAALAAVLSYFWSDVRQLAVSSITSVARRDFKTQRVFGPQQALSRMEALRCATQNGAYLTFDESKKGSLEAGKLADLAVLSADPLTVEEKALADITSAMTMVGGKIVHETPGWN